MKPIRNAIEIFQSINNRIFTIYFSVGLVNSDSHIKELIPDRATIVHRIAFFTL
ncbi:hypothetical protein PSP6_130098 [Paraburkholderia tropica]|nr:hypothetical protein PSP6_130098 [Paraburkholderia tropica]